MADHSDAASCIVLTANIVSAYVSNNTVSSAEIPALISQVYSALMRVSNGATGAGPAEPHVSDGLGDEIFVLPFKFVLGKPH